MIGMFPGHRRVDPWGLEWEITPEQRQLADALWGKLPPSPMILLPTGTMAQHRAVEAAQVAHPRNRYWRRWIWHARLRLRWYILRTVHRFDTLGGPYSYHQRRRARAIQHAHLEMDRYLRDEEIDR